MYWKPSQKNVTPLYEEIADITIHTDDQSAKIVANQIIELLGEN